MDYKLQLPSALDYFTTLVQSDDEFPLMETAVSIAQDEFPKMDIQQVLDEVDVLSARLKRRLMPQADVLTNCVNSTGFFTKTCVSRAMSTITTTRTTVI